MSHTDYLLIFLTRFWAVPLFLLLILALVLVFRSRANLAARLRFSRLASVGILAGLTAAAVAIAPAALGGTTDFVQVLRAAIGMALSVPGPHAVATATIALAPNTDGPQAEPVILQFWAPVDGASVPAAAETGPIACGRLASILRLPKAQSPYPFILFLPWLFGKADEASLLTRSFASHGYVVASFDDPGAAAALANASQDDEKVRLMTRDVSSEASIHETQRRGALRVTLEAAKARDAVDRFAACVEANPALRGKIDFARIGIVGHSIGGATAVEASFTDSRIAAVVNLDGDLFGRAVDNPVRVPYFEFFKDFDPKVISDPSSPRRAEFQFDQRDYRAANAQLKRPDSQAFVIRGSFHDAFADPPPSPPLATVLRWLLLDPYRAHVITEVYLVGFLDAALKGDRRGLIGPNDPRYPEVRAFHFPE